MTLTGNNEAVIGDALRSVVDWVDLCLVIDTGVTDGSLDVAAEVAGDKLCCLRYLWEDDFSKARNFALKTAASFDVHWAILLDTDERIATNGEDMRGVLRKAPADMSVFMMRDEFAHYQKSRCFRLPAPDHFSGPVHEAYPAHLYKTGIFERARFRELPKSAAQLRDKAERDLRILSTEVTLQPKDPRWRYYMGDSLTILGRYEEALEAFNKCSSLRGWDEESAWACYRAAECYLRLDDLSGALTACCEGLERHPGIAELAWLAGFVSFRMGRFEHSIQWAHMAIANGLYKGKGGTVHRVGFRHLPGLYEAPYDIIKHSFKRLGNKRAADEAEAEFISAKVARETA